MGHNNRTSAQVERIYSRTTIFTHHRSPVPSATASLFCLSGRGAPHLHCPRLISSIIIISPVPISQRIVRHMTGYDENATTMINGVERHRNTHLITNAAAANEIRKRAMCVDDIKDFLEVPFLINGPESGDK